MTEVRDQSEVRDGFSLGWVRSDRDRTGQDVSDWDQCRTGETGSKQVRLGWISQIGSREVRQVRLGQE